VQKRFHSQIDVTFKPWLPAPRVRSSRLTATSSCAVQDFDKAIEFKPNFAQTFLKRGIAKLSKDDRVGGNADVAIARRLDPSIGH